MILKLLCNISKLVYKLYLFSQPYSGVNISQKNQNYSVWEGMRLTKFQKLFRSSKKNWDHSYYFCINLILISLPHAFGKKLFKNYQNFSEKSPKFQELFRQQSTRFLRNIYPCTAGYVFKDTFFAKLKHFLKIL